MSTQASTTPDIDQLRHVPTVSVEEAGRYLGVSRAFAYTMVRNGDLPVIRLGTRRVRVPSAKLLRMLGVEA